MTDPAPNTETSDRRDAQQREGRQLGWVVSCTGSSASITCPLDGRTPQLSTWSIGNLVTIVTPESRVVGFVRSVESADNQWRGDAMNTLRADIDLVGEIRDAEIGPSFQRGIQCYPGLGSVAHLIRHSDLQAIYTIASGMAVEIGRLSQDAGIPASIDIESMLKRHFAVVGTTGVGKSTAVSIMIRKAVEHRPHLRVLVLDPHNEFAAAFRGTSRVLDARSFELPFWMLRFEELVDVVFRGREPNDDEIDFLREAVEAAKASYLNEMRNAMPGAVLRRSFRDGCDVVTADRPTPFRLTDVYALIEEEVGRLESRYSRFDLRTLRARLKEVADDPNFAFMFGKASVEDTADQILGRLFNIPSADHRITVLQLAGIPSEAVNAVVSVLARLSFDIAMIGGGELETLLVCEEAHRYVPNDAKLGFAPTRRAIARIAKEGRKYGAYIAIVTQRPGELDPTILSQCSTVFAMRLTNDFDQDIIRSAIADSSTGILAFLSAIGNREAIAFGEAVPTPMRMRFQEIEKTLRPMPNWTDPRTSKSLSLREIVSRMRGMEAAQPGTAIPLQEAPMRRELTASSWTAPQPAPAQPQRPDQWPSPNFRLR